MQVRPATLEEAQPLTSALWEEMVARYGDGEPSPAHPEQFLPPYGVFLVASVDGRDVGCGGLRLLDDGVGEVKRMYVDPQVRGRGVGRALLTALVEHARAAGLTEIRLETGTEQPEAMALYEQAGFVPIAPYGTYKDDARSRCYRLPLR